MADLPPTLNPELTCSICIANYNGEAMLRDCIDSVLAQDCVEAIEIIVHDDASSDSSVALLQTIYPQVRLLQSETNVGFCVANNRMVAHARGEFVLLLNNDAALLSDALATLIGAARSRGSATILTLPQYDWRSGELVDRGCLLDPFYNPVPNLDPARGEVAMAIGACLFLPHSMWEELGGFPEWMESIAEDLYLCCVARLRGHAVIALTASGYRHRRGATFSGERGNANKLTTTFRRRHLSERNKTTTLFVCTPTPLMSPLLVLHLLLLASEGFVLTCAKRDTRVWRDIYGAALRELWSRRRELREARRNVQHSRTGGLFGYARAFTIMPWKLHMLLRHGLPTLRN